MLMVDLLPRRPLSLHYICNINSTPKQASCLVLMILPSAGLVQLKILRRYISEPEDHLALFLISVSVKRSAGPFIPIHCKTHNSCCLV